MYANHTSFTKDLFIRDYNEKYLYLKSRNLFILHTNATKYFQTLLALIVPVLISIISSPFDGIDNGQIYISFPLVLSTQNQYFVCNIYQLQTSSGDIIQTGDYQNTSRDGFIASVDMSGSVMYCTNVRFLFECYFYVVKVP